MKRSPVLDFKVKNSTLIPIPMMKAENFRRTALSMAGTSEMAHMGHPDFRVNGKVFATLHYPDERFGAVMLTPEDQGELIREFPDVFTPANGAWGRGGSTLVRLEAASVALIKKAVTAAWLKRSAGTTNSPVKKRAKSGAKKQL